jgi:hypothetical protein
MARKPVDPFARKMIYGSLVYGGMMLLMFAVLTVIYLHTRPRCSDRVVGETSSPDGKWMATILERRCGAEAPFFTHVNLRPAGEDVKHGFFSGKTVEGEIFLIELDAAGAGITLTWTAPDKLTVRCPGCSASVVQRHDERWGLIAIHYEPSQR